MMTLNKIAYLLMHDLSGGDIAKDSQLDPRDIILKARGYLNTLLKPIYFEKKNDGDNSAISQAIYPFEATLLTDDTGQKYFEVPESYMALAHNKGFHRLYSKGNPYHDYVMQHNPGISSNLPHMKIKNIQYYYLEGRRCVMGRGCTAKKSDKMVGQVINAAPDSIGVEDSLPMVPEQLADLMKMLKQDFAPFIQIPNDMRNNQNNNIK